MELLILCALILCAVLWWKRSLWMTPLHTAQARQQVSSFTQLAGPARAAAISDWLMETADKNQHRVLTNMWPQIEDHLFQVIPDCGPELKQRLAFTLRDCHAICKHRAIQRAIMDLSNSLLT